MPPINSELSSQAMRLFRPPYTAIVLLLGLLGGAIATVYLGQDVNWDLQNYHLYTPHALLAGRYDLDIMPAGIAQTFLNPIVYLIPYLLVTTLSPIWAGAVLGMLHGINLALVWVIAHRVFRGSGSDLPGEQPGQRFRSHYLEWIAVTAVGMTSPIFVSVLGTSFAGASLSIPILAAVVVAVPLFREGPQAARHHLSTTQRAMLAGLLVGAAAGLKLTAGIYVMSMVLALAVALPRCGKLRLVGLNMIGAGVGFAVVGGPWAWFVWARWGSPIYPFYNRFLPPQQNLWVTFGSGSAPSV